MAKVITPKPVSVKMYKTGQTRGADDDVIFQNRVARSSTVLIPYEEYKDMNTKRIILKGDDK